MAISKAFDKRKPAPDSSVSQDKEFMEDMNAITALQEWFESQGIDRIRAVQIALLFLAWETKDNAILREICVRGIQTAPQYKGEQR